MSDENKIVGSGYFLVVDHSQSQMGLRSNLSIGIKEEYLKSNQHGKVNST
jgi:hypothetical protein